MLVPTYCCDICARSVVSNEEARVNAPDPDRTSVGIALDYQVERTSNWMNARNHICLWCISEVGKVHTEIESKVEAKK